MEDLKEKKLTEKPKIEKVTSYYGRSAMAIFIFILIVSGNYLGTLFPCRVQDTFDNNIFFKHFIGFFIMLFFVLLTMPNEEGETPDPEGVVELLQKSFFLYLFFIVLSKTHPYIWLCVFFITSIIYILELRKQEQKHKKLEDKIQSDKIQNFLSLSALCLTFIGFFIFMGSKKAQYKEHFSYFTFVFGKIECRKNNKMIDMGKSIKHILD